MTPRICPSCLARSADETCADCRVPTLDERTLTPRDPYIGALFASQYQVIEAIGDGGMGIVYKARQVSMERNVALKVLRRDLTRDLASVQRFYREMRATARIEHPNSVRVYDFGNADDGALYLAMELIEGVTLAEEMAAVTAFEPPRLLRIGIQIAKALRAAHGEGIVHRDLKPENIMLVHQYGERDAVKVLDFGIARFATPIGSSDRMSLTKTGLVVGTPAYVSPEQATGSQVDPRADLYSLGVVLYQMAAGKLPFDDAEAMGVLYKHVHEAPVPLSRVATQPIPVALAELIMSLLEKDPNRRPPSADALITLLSVSLSPEANPTSAPDLRDTPVRDTIQTVVEEPGDGRRALRSDRRSGHDRRSLAPGGDSSPVDAPRRRSSDGRGLRRRTMGWQVRPRIVAVAAFALCAVVGAWLILGPRGESNGAQSVYEAGGGAVTRGSDRPMHASPGGAEGASAAGPAAPSSPPAVAGAAETELAGVLPARPVWVQAPAQPTPGAGSSDSAPTTLRPAAPDALGLISPPAGLLMGIGRMMDVLDAAVWTGIRALPVDLLARPMDEAAHVSETEEGPALAPGAP